MPPPVDFDALHAALGDPMDLEEPPPAAHEVERTSAPKQADSSGRSSATYASARPHTIPPTRAPAEDIHAPAVIVAPDTNDTVPSSAPKMTMPVRGAPPIPHAKATAPLGAPIPTGPPHHTPSSGQIPAAPPYMTPQSFAAQRHMQQMTVRMPERPINRRPKSPTVVVRGRGPSPRQKLLAFAAMLILFTAMGIAVVILQKPEWVGLSPEPRREPTSSASSASSPPVTSTTSIAPSATATSAAVSATATASGTSAPATSSSAKKPPKPTAPAH